MAAYGLYTHIASNKFRSILLLAGLFVLIYIVVYAGALIAEVVIASDRSVDYYLMAAARDLMLSLPPRSQTNAYWQDTAEILLETARNGRIDPLRDAGAQVSRALQAEGLI